VARVLRLVKVHRKRSNKFDFDYAGESLRTVLREGGRRSAAERTKCSCSETPYIAGYRSTVVQRRFKGKELLGTIHL
jgi:hypothetical protein